MSEERRFDVVLFGATGVTGQRILDFLFVCPPFLSLRLAIAGRSRGKLEALLKTLTEKIGESRT